MAAITVAEKQNIPPEVAVEETIGCTQAIFDVQINTHKHFRFDQFLV